MLNKNKSEYAKEYYKKTKKKEKFGEKKIAKEKINVLEIATN